MITSIFDSLSRKLMVLFLCYFSVFSVLGEEVLYLSNADGDLELYVSDLTTGKTRQLTHNELDDNQASWSPDGQWIVYTGRVGGDLEIFLISSDGKKTQKLTHNEAGIDYSPQWSSNGDKVVYISQANNKHALKVFNIKKNQHSVLVESEFELMSPKWSPNDELISYVLVKGKVSHLQLANVVTKKQIALTSYQKEQQLSHSWSPNSEEIVFCARRDKVIDLFSINITTNKEKQLTDLFTLDTEPAFSPDGSQLLFLSARNDKVRRQLFVGNKSLEKIDAITPKNTEVLDPSWSNSGDQVTFSLYSKKRFVVMITDLKTGKHKVLNPQDKGYQYQPKFRPTS
ncbi:TolB family protein [Thalassotalea atypica]|uniref:TolB family protein n=1 Tax=Thalassotalea atypica TaxID=2054316 RepID=UPI002574133B|nr:hypothetical protein [Thalassotalea atypica]